MDRPEAVRKYFTVTPTRPEDPDYSKAKTQMMIAGGLLLLAIFLILSKQGIPVLLGIASGYFGFKFLKDGYFLYSNQKREYEEVYEKYEKDYRRAEPKPSEEQMDEWTNSDIRKITTEALRRLDLEDDDCKGQEPLILVGPSSSEETRYAYSKDGRTIRYSHLNILVDFLTEWHVTSYQCEHTLEYGQTTNDKTKEFPYSEITDLGTGISKKKIHLVDNVAVFEQGVQEFTLSTSGMNTINVLYQFKRDAGATGELVTLGGGESTITAIRKALRDYKKKYTK